MGLGGPYWAKHVYIWQAGARSQGAGRGTIGERPLHEAVHRIWIDLSSGLRSIGALKRSR